MKRGSELALALANEWENIAESLGKDRQSIECKLITLLRQLEAREKNPTDVVNATVELFSPYPTAHDRLLEAVASAAPESAKGAGLTAGHIKKNRYTVVPVFYGTDRAREERGTNSGSYGPERGELSYGMAEVSIPDDHRMGAIERPRWWKLQFRDDPQKHVVLHSIQELALSDFESFAVDRLESCTKKEVLLFVHGYNVGFESAVLRTAQLAYDLHFEGLAGLYSWPSEGSAPKYTVDEANVTWSRPRFEQFVSMLRDRIGADTIHIVAHSMGSRLVAETMAEIGSNEGPNFAQIRQVAFAAPDIDAATFKDLVVAFKELAERITLYASSNDLPLKASKRVHRYARAGESGLDLLIVDAVDTVDVTELDTSLLGHSYYGENRSVLADLFELIRRGSPPQDRHGIVPKDRYGARYWLFSP